MKTTTSLVNGRRQSFTRYASLVTIGLVAAVLVSSSVSAQSDNGFGPEMSIEHHGIPMVSDPSDPWNMTPPSLADPALAPAPQAPVEPPVPQMRGGFLPEQPGSLIEPGADSAIPATRPMLMTPRGLGRTLFALKFNHTPSATSQSTRVVRRHFTPHGSTLMSIKPKIGDNGQPLKGFETMITQHTSIGFIGLGAMGQRLARRLLDNGFKLIAYDHTSHKTTALGAKGAMSAPSVRQLAMRSEVIVSCLPNDEAVLNVYQGAEGVLVCASQGSIAIEMSTVSPDTSRALHRLGRARGIEVLDVPISGSTPAAEQGTLTLFGGGDPNVFDACQPVFSVLAKQYFHLGPSGSGTTMKLVVNALLGVNMQTIAEAVAFGEKAGLNRELLLEVLAKTAVVSPAHQNKLVRAQRDDYSPQFPLKLMSKDFGLILKKAAELGVPMPATAIAHQINTARAAVNGEEDFSAVIDEMEHLARVRRNCRPDDELQDWKVGSMKQGRFQL